MNTVDYFRILERTNRTTETLINVCVQACMTEKVCVCVSQKSSSLPQAWPVVRRRQSVPPADPMPTGWLRCPSTSPQPEPFPSSLKTHTEK